MEAALRRAAEGFGLELSAAALPFGDGLIHRSWRLTTSQGPHLLQQLNDRVFPDPTAVAENAAAAAARVADALRKLGDHEPRHRLVFARTGNGQPWFRDQSGAVWRAIILIPDARPADPTCPFEVRAAARALGRFPGLNAAGAGPAPIEVLPGFHDTPSRLTALQTAARADHQGRLESCRAETERLCSLAPLAHRLVTAGLPRRLVHNDAKLENVLVDDGSGKALCVIDLDTVMPGLAAHDFGDLVRSAVTGCPEDEPELERITVRIETFRDLAGEYLAGASTWLTSAERARLVDGALVITFEQALRFLSDYLAGDVYYPVDDDQHNLRRAQSQLRLLEALLARESQLRAIIDSNQSCR